MSKNHKEMPIFEHLIDIKKKKNKHFCITPIAHVEAKKVNQGSVIFSYSTLVDNSRSLFFI